MTLKQRLKKFLKGNSRGDASFTLIELVIVIGILAILAVVIILVLNPSEFLRQARDSTRMSDLQTLHSALGQYQADGGTSLGSSNKVYVSIPSSQTNCSDLGLPTLPDDWAYKCSNSTNYRKTEGSGWIPVLFSNTSYGNVLNILPIDPVNATSTGEYYTYVAGGSWELNAILESSKYRNNASIVKRNLPGVFAVGSNLSLSPITNTSGLVGYWKFDEGSGTTAGDSSGNNTGTWYGTGSHWATGKVENYAGQFNGSNDYVNLGIDTVSQLINGASATTWTAWVKYVAVAPYDQIEIIRGYGVGGASTAFAFHIKNNNKLEIMGRSVGTEAGQYAEHTTTLIPGQWYFVVGILDYLNDRILLSLNGESFETTSAAFSSNTYVHIGGTGYKTTISSDAGEGRFFNGLIDDVRIYNRALSAAEIAAIYNATR